MDPMDPMPLPPDWLAALHEWAPSALAGLLITTALVHLLLPIARAVERWAIVSAATWDDGPAHQLVSVLEWLASATAAILAWIPRLAIGGTRPPSTPPRPPPSALVVLLVVLVVPCGGLASGCGASSLKINGLVAQAMLEVQMQSGPTIRAARREAMIAAAQAVHDAGGSRAEAEAAAAQERTRWVCAVSGNRTYAGQTGAYIDQLALARVADREVTLEDGYRLASPALDAYRSTRTCLEAIGHADVLPAEPDFASAMPPAWVRADAARRQGAAQDGGVR